MFSRGVLNGASINAFSLNGGNFVQEADGSNTVAFNAALTFRRRLGVTGVNVVTTTNVARLVVRGMRGVGTASFSGTAKAKRRLVLPSSDSVGISEQAKATRRVRMFSIGTVDQSATLRLALRYMAQTDIKRVMRLQHSRTMHLPLAARTMSVGRPAPPMIAPATGGDLP
ncbi:hypothetical protein IB276_10700 [Ensifer sp. ENS04]|uniref:hypothetical protein n=1 Tax=Ensifer sp. ENS04 TaxID=2769281 RepID=UPI00177CB9D2|nr:hypothetical protein [Ensifer sp. ENS04]MBD9539923.1 hypothetical protein [Ensifer sp. ENS04]